MTFIGCLKSDILQRLGGAYVEFGHWVYLPEHRLLLSFDRQRCHGMAHL